MTRVFLSSTALDLASERNAAADAINKLNGYTCVRMEDFGAISDIPLDACLAKLRECEIYLALIGHRYGSCPPGENLSYTEAEYQEAVRRKLLCLTFIMPDGARISAQNIQSDPQRSKQTAFRDLVKAERVCAPFEDEKDLKFKIAFSIANIRTSHAVDGPNARTVLMFPFVSSISGSDTAITIANTSALPDKPSMWMGGVVLYFFGWTPENGCSVVTKRYTGLIPPGNVVAFTLSAGGGAPFGSVEALPDFQGYLVAVCAFAAARGVAFYLNKAGEAASTCYAAETIRPDWPD